MKKRKMHYIIIPGVLHHTGQQYSKYKEKVELKCSKSKVDKINK